MIKRTLTIGTRGSQLALAQAQTIKAELDLIADVRSKIEIIKTTGDVLVDQPIGTIEGKGVFTKQIEEALLAGQIDLAVHSLKDLMTASPPGLKLGAVGFREDRRDVLVMRPGVRRGTGVMPLGPSATVGTGSERRACQVCHHCPAATVRDLRGNVPTRIDKLRQGQYDAIIVAAAGVTRLGLDLSDLDCLLLDPEDFVPAPGQGMLAVQIRSHDPQIEEIVKHLDSTTGRREGALERGLLARFEAGCSLPLGVYSQLRKADCRLVAVLGTIDRSGNRVGLKRAAASGSEEEAVVSEVYRQLRSEPVEE